MAKAASRVVVTKIEEIRKSVLDGVEINREYLYDNDGNLYPGGEKFIEKFGTFESVSEALLANGVADILGLNKATYGLDINSRGEIVATFGFNGENGSMDRSFVYDPDTNEWTVKHELFLLKEEKRSSGAAVSMMKSAVEFYIQHGINSFDVNASLTNGGYTWTRFGAVILESGIIDKLRSGLKRLDIPEDVRDTALQILENGSSYHDLWRIADMKHITKVPFESDPTRMKTLGQALFSNIGWNGKISFKKGSVERERTLKYIYESCVKRGIAIPENYVTMWMDR